MFNVVLNSAGIYRKSRVLHQSFIWRHLKTTRAPSQYPKRRLSVRSRKVSKPRDLYLKLSDRSEICQALRQQCCRCACQISKRYDNLKYQSRGFETLRDLTKRRLFGYWDGAQDLHIRPIPVVYTRVICKRWIRKFYDCIYDDVTRSAMASQITSLTYMQ